MELFIIHSSPEDSARLRHVAALAAKPAFRGGARSSAAARPKCAAASLSSAAERGPTSQAQHCPHSAIARISLASTLSGAALTTLADYTYTLDMLTDIDPHDPTTYARLRRRCACSARGAAHIRAVLADLSACAASSPCGVAASSLQRPCLPCASAARSCSSCAACSSRSSLRCLGG